MNRRNIIRALFVLAVSSSAQNPIETIHSNPLHWNWNRMEELSSTESISRAKVTVEERERLIRAIMGELKESADLDLDTEDDLRKVAVETRIKYFDLDGDHVPEIVAQAGGYKSGCSPTGNCPFWILRRHGRGYEVLLGDNAQTFTIQRTRTKVFRDLVLMRHGSAFDSEARLFRFDGNEYREASCYDVVWEDPTGNGQSKIADFPNMTPCGTPQSWR